MQKFKSQLGYGAVELLVIVILVLVLLYVLFAVVD